MLTECTPLMHIMISSVLGDYEVRINWELKFNFAWVDLFIPYALIMIHEESHID